MFIILNVKEFFNKDEFHLLNRLNNGDCLEITKSMKILGILDHSRSGSSILE